MSGRYQAPSVRKAFEILELVCRRRDGASLSELSRELGISKSTALGIADALTDRGALVRDGGTKRWSPGLALLRLGRAAHERLDIRDAARPFMEGLGERTQETVFLGVRAGDHVYIVDAIQSALEIKITSSVGTRIPLLAGATGKVLMALLGEDEVRRIVLARGLAAYTPRTVTDPESYFEKIREARQRGYATDDEEYIEGVRAVAAAVRTSPESAVWVVGLTASMTDEKMERIAAETAAAAAAIGRALEPAAGEEAMCPTST